MTEIQGKSILVRVNAKFELARVRVIGSRLYFHLYFYLLHEELDLINFLFNFFYEPLFFVAQFVAVGHVCFDSVKDHFASESVRLVLCISSAYPGLGTQNEPINKQPIKLTITQFPRLFSPKELTMLDENPTRKTRSLFLSHPVIAYLHMFITVFGSPSPNLVVLPNITKLWG